MNRLVVDDGTREVFIEKTFYKERNVSVLQWLDRFRMYHLRPIICHLNHFFIIKVIDEYGVTQPNGAVTLQANGSYSFTLTLPATKNGSDKDGHLYTIVVTGVDQAGNTATATTTLRIN